MMTTLYALMLSLSRNQVHHLAAVFDSEATAHEQAIKWTEFVNGTIEDTRGKRQYVHHEDNGTGGNLAAFVDRMDVGATDRIDRLANLYLLQQLGDAVMTGESNNE